MKKLFIILSISFFFSFVAENHRPIHIFMIGDSTMANKTEREFPEMGWGQVLEDFFTDSVKVVNYAKNGRSSKSFLNEGLWDSVMNNLSNGDYVIIQFGHNDKKPDEKRHTDPFTSYKDILKGYISDTRSKGGIPILCTSIVRRHFDTDGNLIDTHGYYLKAVKEVVEETGVNFIDMEARTGKYIENLGPQRSKYLFMFLEPGVYPNRPSGKKDSTHLTQLGAYTIAHMATEAMKEKNIGLSSYLRNK